MATHPLWMAQSVTVHCGARPRGLQALSRASEPPELAPKWPVAWPSKMSWSHMAKHAAGEITNVLKWAAPQGAAQTCVVLDPSLSSSVSRLVDMVGNGTNHQSYSLNTCPGNHERASDRDGL